MSAPDVLISETRKMSREINPVPQSVDRKQPPAKRSREAGAKERHRFQHLVRVGKQPRHFVLFCRLVYCTFHFLDR